MTWIDDLLTATCTLQQETHTTNEIGERVRGFSDGVSVPCRLEPFGRGVNDDLAFGQIIEENRYTLFLKPTTTITTSHKVVQDGIDYKVDRVRKLRDIKGALHHLECDLQEIQ